MIERTELSQRSIDVVAGVIRREDGRILICLRPAHRDQGGLWEFPGGKREPGETRIDALARELHEELGIGLKRATPLLRIKHAYADKCVDLDVWETCHWVGEPAGKEGQQIRWALPAELRDYAFPAANRTVVTAARLPRLVLVIPAAPGNTVDFTQALESCLEAGVRCILSAAPPPAANAQFARDVQRLCRHYGALVQFGVSPGAITDWRDDPSWSDAAVGLHLERGAKPEAPIRSGRQPQLLSASCASIEELERAERLCADFVLIPLTALPDEESVRWQRLAGCVAHTPLPAYALGDVRDIDLAIAAGCQGIAISGGLWLAPRAVIREAVLRSLDAGAVRCAYR